jgi:hypothetical protein
MPGNKKFGGFTAIGSKCRSRWGRGIRAIFAVWTGGLITERNDTPFTHLGEGFSGSIAAGKAEHVSIGHLTQDRLC